MRSADLLALLALAVPIDAAATPRADPGQAGNMIRNGSFETGDFAPDPGQVMSLVAGARQIDGWTVTGDVLSWIGPGGPWNLSASDGTHFLDLTDYSYGPPFGGLAQRVATRPGTTYEISFDLGSSSDYGAFAGVTVSAAGKTETRHSDNPGTEDHWERRSVRFTATDDTTTITFTGAEGANYIGLDNVLMVPVKPPLSSKPKR